MRVILNGQDVGKEPLEFWGDSDYEFSTYVSAKHKDDVSYALTDKLKDENPEAYVKLNTMKSEDDVIISAIELLYAGNPSAVSEFKDNMRSVGIEAEFWSWA